MFIVMQQVLLLILFAAVGYILCKMGKVKSEQTKLLSTLQVYVFWPCSVINTYSANFTVEYIQEKYSLLLVSLILLAVMIVVGGLLAKLLAKKSYLQAVYCYSLTVSNYGFFGYSLAAGLFGDIMLQNVMIFSLPISMYTSTLGYAMLTKTKFSPKRFINPIIVASLIGAVVGLFEWELPYVLDALVDKAGACMAPVGMLLAGMVISEFNLKEILKGKRNYMVAVLRLLVLPCSIAGELKLLGLEEMIIPALMVYAMPCGSNAITFPRLVGKDCKDGASVLLITSLLACITVPICVALFT